jgi:hypothetical protein
MSLFFFYRTLCTFVCWTAISVVLFSVGAVNACISVACLERTGHRHHYFNFVHCLTAWEAAVGLELTH